jgi:SAM-dependent methyltransferase
MSAYDESKRRAWAGHASTYERTFAHLCAHTGEALLEAVVVGPHSRLLDVGTGTGTIAALGLARGASVTAIDPDPGMCRIARRKADGAHVVQCALPRLPFGDGTFDAVTANFVLNQVGDPRSAVAELRRVARPGARVGASVWPRPLTPLHLLWEDVLDAAGVHRPEQPTVPASLDFARTPSGLGELLTGGGLDHVVTRTVTFTHRVDPEVWWSGPANGIASIGAIVAAQSPATRADLKDHYDRLSRRYLGADGLLHLPTSAVLATGVAT